MAEPDSVDEMQRWCAVLTLMAGCVQSSSLVCPDGRVCPSGSQCYEPLSICVVPEQLTVCEGALQESPCVAAGTNGYCISGACIDETCGDDIAIGNEECDGVDLAGETCASLGYYNEVNVPACTASCRLDASNCGSICGDGVVDDIERCDSASTVVLGTCTDFGYYEGGNVACSSLCAPDVAHCTGYCGDGIDQPREICELGISSPAETCLDLGYDAGRIACSALCAPAFDHCQRIGWQRLLPPSADQFTGVWSAASGELFLAGCGSADIPTIYRLDGDALARYETTATGCMNALWGTSATNIWGVGANGLIVHFDGTTASSVASPTTAQLLGIWGSSTNDIHVVGSNGAILHYDGASWTPLASSPTSSWLRAVWGSSATNVLAVGDDGTILRFDGTWSAMTSNTSSNLHGVWGTASDNVYAVGGATGLGTIVHFDGDWSPVTLPDTYPFLRAIWGRSAEDIYIAGNGGVILHGEGRVWRQLAIGGVNLQSIGGTNERVIAAGSSGRTLSHGGASYWSRAFASPADVWAGTTPGDELVLSSTALYTDVRNPPIYSNPSPSSGFSNVIRAGNEIFITDLAGRVHHFDGSWSVDTVRPAANLGQIWASSADDVWVQLGSDNEVAHYNGSTWSFEEVTTDTSVVLSSLWGFAPGELFSVGRKGTDGVAYRRAANGTWSETPLPANAPFLNAVWGTSGTNMLAGGFSALYRFDGSTWTAVSLPAEMTIFDIRGSAADDVFVVGTEGLIVRYDGVAWTEVRSQTNSNLLDVAARSDLVLMLEQGGTLRLLVRPGPW